MNADRLVVTVDELAEASDEELGSYFDHVRMLVDLLGRELDTRRRPSDHADEGDEPIRLNSSAP